MHAAEFVESLKYRLLKKKRYGIPYPKKFLQFIPLADLEINVRLALFTKYIFNNQFYP